KVLSGIGAVRVAVSGATAAVVVTALMWGGATALAADYQDAKGNVCEGNILAHPFCNWKGKVTGFNNTALGAEALFELTGGSDNTATGEFALFHNTTGRFNTASGFAALSENTTGSWNTASGVAALSENTVGSFNTASGQAALLLNTTGSENTASGSE